ncbi:hypothetical protein HDE_06150 [Halotydeus destructor]|nr:hypothetical protein HDE_06150 [Halotydeus destructor]
MHLREVRDKLGSVIDFRDYVDSEIAKVKNDDKWLSMFVTAYQDMDKIVNSVIKCLDWRRKYEIYNLDVADLPREYFECGKLRVGQDVDGRPCLMDNVGLHRRLPYFSPISTRAMYYMACHMSSFGKNSNLYVDVSEFEIRSLDMTASRLISEISEDNFPGCVDKVFIYGVNRFLLPLVKGVIAIWPSKIRAKVSFLSRDEAEARIVRSAIFVPENIGTLDSSCHKYGITNADQILELKTYFSWVSGKTLKK